MRTGFWRVPESGSNLKKGCLPPEFEKHFLWSWLLVSDLKHGVNP